MTDPADKNNVSTFVTVLGWLTIILAGMNVLILLSQLAVVSTFELPETERTSVYSMISGFALLSITALAAGVGLVKRLNWARLVLLGFFALFIVGQCVGIYLMMEFRAEFSETPETNEGFARFQNSISIIRYLFTVGLIAISAFCIYKLSSQEVHDEFNA